jgi:prepilin-type processing-associated H-X9-DG protein
MGAIVLFVDGRVHAVAPHANSSATVVEVKV